LKPSQLELNPKSIQKLLGFILKQTYDLRILEEKETNEGGGWLSFCIFVSKLGFLRKG